MLDACPGDSPSSTHSEHVAKAKSPETGAADSSAQRRVTEEDAEYVKRVMRLLGHLANLLRLTGIAGPGSDVPREMDPDLYEATMSQRAITDMVRRSGGESMLIDGEAAARLLPLAELTHSLALTTLEPCKLGSVHMPSALGCVGMLCYRWQRFTSSTWFVAGDVTNPRDLYFDEGEEDRVRVRALHEVKRLIQLQQQRDSELTVPQRIMLAIKKLTDEGRNDALQSEVAKLAECSARDLRRGEGKRLWQTYRGKRVRTTIVGVEDAGNLADQETVVRRVAKRVDGQRSQTNHDT